MSAIITLTTDFGTQDGYVGAMKGRLLSMSPTVNIVDITHDIAPQDLLGAAWCLARSTPLFPAGSIHIAVVDPEVGSSRTALIIQVNDQWLVGPDNGVFTRVIQQSSNYIVYSAFKKTDWWQPHQSFDGLAVFSPIAACLANQIPLDKLGRETDDFQILTFPRPLVEKKLITGEIVTFDRFGNAITNIQQTQIKQLSASPTITTGSISFTLNGFYGENGTEFAIAIINSDGLLELSKNRGSAKDEFGLHIGMTIWVGERIIRV